MSETSSIIIMTFASFLAALGQLGLKVGSSRLKKNIDGVIKNCPLLAGVFFYMLSSVISIIALKGSELSVLYPIASLNYVWVSFLSIKFLKEKMNKYKWAGIALIIIGVSIIL
ncbi:EamA family transporter [Candidatus Woesearchaeota archaeon]|nr:EamA family transporter [Candidatus Woesearchaeota archaeon]